MIRMLSMVVGMTLLGSVPAFAQETEADIARLLDHADDVGRGESSHAVMEMHVKTDRYERTMKMESWAKGKDKTLIRILEPAKDAGITTLKVDDNLWNYLPKVDRTMKVPAGMMSGSWMGSHFSNDDLVKESRMSEDFTWTVDQRPEAGKGQWVITLTPKPDAPVVWGKVVATIDADERPRDIRYYDEKGGLVRVMSFQDYKTFGGHDVPGRMRLTPQDKPDEFTEISYDTLDFDTPIDDSLFSLQTLRK